MIIVGTLRVHSGPPVTIMAQSHHYPLRDTAAEGQLWIEENALERAEVVKACQRYPCI